MQTSLGANSPRGGLAGRGTESVRELGSEAGCLPGSILEPNLKTQLSENGAIAIYGHLVAEVLARVTSALIGSGDNCLLECIPCARPLALGMNYLEGHSSPAVFPLRQGLIQVILTLNIKSRGQNLLEARSEVSKQIRPKHHVRFQHIFQEYPEQLKLQGVRKEQTQEGLVLNQRPCGEQPI